MSDKVMTMREAISAFVRPGDTIFFAGMQHGEPVAAIHEIIRQKIDRLTVVSALASSLGLLVGEGLVKKLLTGFFRDLFEKKKAYTVVKAKKNDAYPEILEYSHFGLSLALLAGEMGIPFIPTRTHLGSDIEKWNENIARMKCPFTGQTAGAIKAINPDVGIIHVQRADGEGNAQKWGSLGMDRMGINACNRIVVTAETLVDSTVIRKDANRTLIPGMRVHAVVEEPWGAYPIHLAGCYHSDMANFFEDLEGKGEEAYETYVREFVYGVKNRQELIRKVKQVRGEDYFDKLKIKEPVWSDPINTGV